MTVVPLRARPPGSVYTDVLGRQWPIEKLDALLADPEVNLTVQSTASRALLPEGAWNPAAAFMWCRMRYPRESVAALLLLLVTRWFDTDVDRQEAAFVVVGVEQRELLMPVHDIAGVVDVERDGLGWRGVAGAIEIDHHPPEPDQVAQAGGVLHPRDGGLAHQVHATLGQPPAGELEGGVGAQVVEVVGILVTAGDGQDAGEQDLGQRMHDPARVPPVGDHGRELLGDAQPPRRLRKQQDATVRGQASAIEGGCELLASHGWKRERQRRRI